MTARPALFLLVVAVVLIVVAAMLGGFDAKSDETGIAVRPREAPTANAADDARADRVRAHAI